MRKIVVQYRLQPFVRNVLIHGFQAAGIVDFKLLVALLPVGLFAAVLALMIPDTGGETPADTLVAAIFTMPSRKEALSLEDTVMPTKGRKIRYAQMHLTELAFMHIQRIDLVIVDDGTKPRAGQGHFRHTGISAADSTRAERWPVHPCGNPTVPAVPRTPRLACRP